MKPEFKIVDEYSNRRMSLRLHEREAASWEARLACALIERWGLAMGDADGEDSAGRQKVRIATPQEVVSRACEMAALAVAEFRSRDWVVVLPSIDEICKATPDKDED